MSPDQLPEQQPTGPPATASDTRPWPKLSPLRRFGPVVLVLVLLVVIGGIATLKGKSDDLSDQKAAARSPNPSRSASGTSPDSTPETEASGETGYADNPRLPVFYNEAKAANTLDEFDWGERCDPNTGRVKVPTVYALPCVPVWAGNKPWVDQGGTTQMTNGGVTSAGITTDTIKVVFYVASAQDIASAFQALGVLDSNDATFQILQEVVAMHNEITETYGRKVVIEQFQASGDGKDPTSARADAIKVATESGAFASIGGPTQTAAYQDELARRGVLCIACGQATPGSSYQKDAPYAWGTLANPDQLVNGVLDFGVKNLFGKPARFAGDPALRSKTRNFGVVHYEQDPPVFGDLERETTARLEAAGYKAGANLSYLLNLDTLNAQAQTIIGKLKAADVTSVVFLGDPLMPKYLTEQATRQNYFPEWVITGTVFTDSTAAGRLYDQKQWAHAFGASSLPARTAPESQLPQRLYRWFYGKAPEYTRSLPILSLGVSLLFTGIGLAGPDLTAETFAGGMFRYPPSGGGPTTPRISFGYNNDSDVADFTGPDDITTVWWDAEVEGPSEQGIVAKGMWTYPLGGRRFPLNDLPELPDTGLFRNQGAVTLSEEAPPEDQTADYPPWPGSPAA